MSCPNWTLIVHSKRTGWKLLKFILQCSNKISGRSKEGGTRDACPPGSKFFQYHEVFGEIWQNRKIVSWRPHLGEILDPPLKMINNQQPLHLLRGALTSDWSTNSFRIIVCKYSQYFLSKVWPFADQLEVSTLPADALERLKSIVHVFNTSWGVRMNCSTN